MESLRLRKKLKEKKKIVLSHLLRFYMCLDMTERAKCWWFPKNGTASNFLGFISEFMCRVL